MRRLSSGPWQVKQLSERIGRTSRSKSTGLSAARHTPAVRTNREKRTNKGAPPCSFYCATRPPTMRADAPYRLRHPIRLCAPGPGNAPWPEVDDRGADVHGSPGGGPRGPREVRGGAE